MDKDNLRIILEQNGVDQNEAEDIIELISHEGIQTEVVSESTFDKEALIQQLLNEPDWRRKAAIAARLYNINNYEE
jgi:hypothetical protein